jgi:hypothetical protein
MRRFIDDARLLAERTVVPASHAAKSPTAE